MAPAGRDTDRSADRVQDLDDPFCRNEVASVGLAVPLFESASQSTSRPRWRSISVCMYEADRPTNRSTTSVSLRGHPRTDRISASTRTASRSLSTRTPSQSKTTRSKPPSRSQPERWPDSHDTRALPGSLRPRSHTGRLRPQLRMFHASRAGSDGVGVTVDRHGPPCLRRGTPVA